MNTTAKTWAFLGALLVGVLAAAYGQYGPTIDSYLHTRHLHVQDWSILIFGSLCVGCVAYSFVMQPDTFDWRWSFWFVIGGVMIYAVLGDVAWLKEASCRIVDGRHHGAWSHPCYQTN